MKKIYQDQWDLFKTTYWKYFVGLFLFFILAGVLAFYYMQSNHGLMNSLMAQIYQMFEETDLLDPDMSTGGLAAGLFLNNSRASLMIAASGFIPIFLPAIGILFFNGAIIGVLFAFMDVQGAPVFSTFMSGIVPHGIFEIPAIILSGALAFYVTLGIYRKINNDQYSFKNCALNAGKTFLFVVIPLLVIAAIVEAFVTPAIMEMVL